MSRYQSDSSGAMSPYAAAAGGAAGGAAAVLVGQQIKSAKNRATWALGIGVVLTGLSAVASSDLNANQTTAQQLAQQAQAFQISTASNQTATSIAADLQNLRAHQVQQDNLMAQISYSANLFAWGGSPVGLSAPVQGGAITPTALTTTNNNTSILVLGLIALAVVALVLV